MTDEDWRADLHRDLAASKRRSKRVSPYDTGAWKTRRNALKHDAVCLLCARFGLQVPGEVADHVMPQADSREDFIEAPLQPLCSPCHVIKRKIEGRWRRGELRISELDLSISKEGARLRAAAFGVGVDGLALVPYPRSR
jgi:hypothetical protein